jgi:hypothetical protein
MAKGAALVDDDGIRRTGPFGGDKVPSALHVFAHALAVPKHDGKLRLGNIRALVRGLVFELRGDTAPLGETSAKSARVRASIG